MGRGGETIAATTVAGDRQAHAGDAVRDLQATGFSHDEISIMGCR
jgi:hypothetical protein